MTEKFLTENQLFTSEEVAEIVHAIRWHNSVKRDPGRLLAILRDADMLEIFGAVGLIRAFTSKAMLPEYDAAMLPAETWGLSAEGFTQRFASGAGIGATIMDQVDFQISCFENLNTEIARQIARPLVDYMRGFATQLVKEITSIANYMFLEQLTNIRKARPTLSSANFQPTIASPAYVSCIAQEWFKHSHAVTSALRPPYAEECLCCRSPPIVRLCVRFYPCGWVVWNLRTLFCYTRR